MKGQPPRVLTVRYVGALLVVAGLLVAGQVAVQFALDRQEGDARVINIAGRQRMLSQRLTMLLLDSEADLHELAGVADEWERSQDSLQHLHGGNSEMVQRLFEQIDGDHRAMLAAARGAIAAGAPGSAAGFARIARAHEEGFLAGMNQIVAAYEAEARARVVALRRTELALLLLALSVLALEGVYVFRPAVRGLREYLAARDQAQHLLLQVTDGEQKRIAQDVHDGLGQHLIGVSFLVKSLQQDLAGSPHLARVEEVGRLLAESVDQTRGLVRSLHSHVLESEGIVPALRELAAHTERVFAIECRVRADAAHDDLPLVTRGHLYRIGREAVHNAAKHSHAASIMIELGGDASRVTLTVRDDGVGIGTPSRDGMGLHLMRSRAKMLEARLEIIAGVPRGTVVTCTVPIMGPHA